MQIPNLTESTRLSPNSPVEVASSRDARIPGQTLSALGESIGEIGQIMRTAQNQVDETKARDQISLHMHDAREHALKVGKPDGSDYEDIFNQQVDKNVSSIFNQYSDPALIRRIEIDAGHQKTAQTIGVRNDAFKAQQKYILNGNEEIIAMREKRAFDNPDVAALDYVDFRDNHIKPLQGKAVVSAETAIKLDEVARERISEAYFDGLLNKKKFKDAAQVLGATEQDLTLKLSAEELGMYGLKADGSHLLPMVGKDKKTLSPEVSELIRGLKPDKREKLVAKLQSAMELETKVKLHTINTNVQAYVGYAMSGQPVSVKEKANVRAMVSNMADPYLKAQYTEMLDTADKVAPVVEIAKEGTPDQVNKALEKLGTSLGNPQDLGSRYKADGIKQKAYDAIRKIQEERVKDPMADSLNDDSLTVLRQAAKSGEPQDVQNYVGRSLDVQSHRGVPAHQLRVTTKQEAQMLADRLRSAQMIDYATMANELDRVEQQYGPHFEKAIAEVTTEDKSLSESVMLAAQVSNMGSKREILENLQKKKAIEEAFKQRSETSQKDLNDNVQDQMDKFSATLGANMRSADGLTTVNRFQEQITLQAKKNMAMRQMDVDSAVDAAYKEIVEKNYDVVQTDRSQILMPKKSAYNPELVERFTSDFAPQTGNRPGMQVLGIGPTEKDYQELMAKNPGQTKEQIKDAYIASVLANGRWISNGDQTGVSLVVDIMGRFVPVYRENGTRVDFSFRELGNYTTPTEFPGLRK